MRVSRTLGLAALLISACSLLEWGCSGNQASRVEDGNRPPADDPTSDDSGTDSAASSGWVRSEDGKLSLRIMTAHGAVDAGEPIPILAELRNDTDETLGVLWPFGDLHQAEAVGIEIVGPNGKVRNNGPTASYSLGVNSFTHLGAGDVLQNWLRLDEGNFAGIDATGRYTIRYTYRATPAHRKAAERFGVRHLWTGEVRTAAVTLTRQKAAPGDNRGQGVEDSVIVRIPRGEYRFTLDEVAKGVRFDYDVVVEKKLAGMIPLPQDAGGADGAGPSSLMPFEEISGDGHAYALRDVGHGPPPDRRPRTIEKGTLPLSFGWDGRNWSGPSDTNRPKGEPFPPGAYTLRVSVKGEVDTPQGHKPYEVSDTAKVILTP